MSKPRRGGGGGGGGGAAGAGSFAAGAGAGAGSFACGATPDALEGTGVAGAFESTAVMLWMPMVMFLSGPAATVMRSPPAPQVRAT
jgi:hypothetical protein